jgi:hypothetical protein
MATKHWSFDGYDFPYADAPSKGSSNDWNREEKLVEHDPLSANVTILTSWGLKSARRTITGICGINTRNTMKAKYEAKIVGPLIDGERRQVNARITRADFETLSPITLRFKYTIEFMQR